MVFDHAYHGRTNLTMALTAKNMPYKHGFGPFAGEVYRVPMSYPFRDAAGLTGEQAAARAIRQIETQVGAANVAAVLIEPIQGEGGFVVPAAGFLPAIAAVVPGTTAPCSSPTRSRPASAAPATGSPATHEGVVPDLITTAKGIAGGLPLAAVTGRAEIMDAVHPRRAGRHLRRQPGRLRRRARRDRDHARARPRRRRPRHRGDHAAAAARAAGARPARSATSAGRGAMIAVELVRPGTTEPDAALAGGRRQGLPRRGRRRPHRRHLRQRAALPAAAGDRPGPAGRGPRRHRGGVHGGGGRLTRAAPDTAPATLAPEGGPGGGPQPHRRRRHDAAVRRRRPGGPAQRVGRPGRRGRSSGPGRPTSSPCATGATRAVYGRTTGVGANRHAVVDPQAADEHGLRLLRSHAGGTGDPCRTRSSAPPW